MESWLATIDFRCLISTNTVLITFALTTNCIGEPGTIDTDVNWLEVVTVDLEPHLVVRFGRGLKQRQSEYLVCSWFLTVMLKRIACVSPFSSNLACGCFNFELQRSYKSCTGCFVRQRYGLSVERCVFISMVVVSQIGACMPTTMSVPRKRSLDNGSNILDP